MSAHPEEDPTVEKRMTLLDTVLEANPYLNEAEKGVAKRTERVRYEITSKLAEVKALHARHASDALKRPPVEELLKLIREAMPSVDSAELGLTHEEAQRWWAELTDACRPVRPVARAPSGGKAAAAAAAAATARALANVVTTAELVQPIEALALTMAVVVADAPAAAHDPSKRQSRSIEWGEALESVSFEKLDFDEARFKELCVSDQKDHKAIARTMGTAAMKKTLLLTCDRIFEWANEDKLQMCEGKWPKGDSLRSWVLRPALPEGRDSQLTVKVAYSNSAKAFQVHATHLPRKLGVRRSTGGGDSSPPSMPYSHQLGSPQPLPLPLPLPLPMPLSNDPSTQLAMLMHDGSAVQCLVMRHADGSEDVEDLDRSTPGGKRPRERSDSAIKSSLFGPDAARGAKKQAGVASAGSEEKPAI